ncbi:Terminase-like family protein [compost metagenome]
MEFPELKQMVLDDWKEWEPDGIIIEKKASGAPLIYELRSMGIPVQEFTPSKGQDKIARANAVSDLFASGRIWVPETRWAEEVIEECVSFPSAKHDDFVDSTTQALLRLRKGGLVKSTKDEAPEPQYFRSPRRKGYY